MSSSAARKTSNRAPGAATVFAALGDPTRLALVARLCGGSRISIAQLTEGSPLTRQAISKHLRVLEDAGLVLARKSGRENRYAYNPQPFRDARDFIDGVAREWDQALGRLKSFVER